MTCARKVGCSSVVRKVINKTRDGNQNFNETIAKWRSEAKTIKIHDNVVVTDSKAIRPTYPRGQDV